MRLRGDLPRYLILIAVVDIFFPVRSLKLSYFIKLDFPEIRGIAFQNATFWGEVV